MEIKEELFSVLYSIKGCVLRRVIPVPDVNFRMIKVAR